jgi:4-amino-4-deoxy-L-arabinose transferase-like glycosyltransferase
VTRPVAPVLRGLLRPQGVAIVVLLLFVLLANVYACVNPILESPDEITHYGVIEYLVHERRLPVQVPGEKTAYMQEGSQPPLYYVLGALLAAPAIPEDGSDTLVHNPHARIGVGLARDNVNLLVHQPDEGWPWRGVARGVHRLRLYSIALGCLTLAAIHALGRLVFPEDPWLATAAMAWAALNPMFLYLSASINNDNLVIMLCSWGLVGMVLVLREGNSWRRSATLGLLCGLAALAKVSGLSLLALAVLAIGGTELLALPRTREDAHSRSERPASRAFQAKALRRAAQRAAGHVLLAAALAVALAGWWYLRNYRLYGEFLGVQRMLDIFGRRSDAFSWRAALAEYQGFRISFWALFGYVNVMLRWPWVYVVLESFFAFGLLGALRSLLATCPVRHGAGRWPWRRWAPPALLLVWIAAIHVALLRWTSMTQASQGRLAFPALGALALLMFWGLGSWLPARYRHRATLAAVLCVAAVGLSAPWTTLGPAYAPPRRLTLEQIDSAARPFGARYADGLDLVAWRIEPTTLEPGGHATLTLYWQVLQPVDRDYSIYIHLFGRNGQTLATRDGLAGMGNYPTSRWQAGEVLEERYEFDVSASARAPVAARLNVGLYEYDGMERPTVTDGLGRPVLQPTLGLVKISGQGDAGGIAPTLDYTLGDGVRLLGGQLPATAQPGTPLPVRLLWETAPLDADYTVFVHLVAEDGSLIGQGDGPPMGGEYPTRYWGSGERVDDPHLVSVEKDAPAGQARLLVGLYNAEGQRLPVSLAGEPAGDAAAIGSVTIVTAPLDKP